MAEKAESIKKLQEKAEKQGNDVNEENTYTTNNGKEVHFVRSSDSDDENVNDPNYDPFDF